MKVLLLWAVAAWVVAVTADRPCAEYCVYLSSGTRDIEFQAGCDCMYEDTEFQDQMDDSGIYYEPVDYIPVPAYIHNHPFYILNPIIQGRQMYSADINPIMTEDIQPFLNSRPYNADIDLNGENTHSTHSRKGKNIRTNTERLSAPIYLDINLEPSNERSATTFTADEIKLTEQSFLECANLYAAIDPRKRSETTEIKSSPSNEYSQHSNSELRKVIDYKCSHISNIIEKSRNEIENTRPKLARITFRMDSDDQHHKPPRPNDMLNTNDQVPCLNIADNKNHPTIQNKNNENIISAAEPQTNDIYTDPNENSPGNEEILFSEESSTSGAASTSLVNMQSPYDIYSQTEDISEGFTRKLVKKRPINSPTNMKNEYPLHKDFITFDPATSDSSTTTTNIVEQGSLENQITGQGFTIKNVEGRYENRSQYEEGEVPVIKIITHEFSNDTVQSFINGTEDIPNDDYKEEIQPEVYTGNENSSKIALYSQNTVSTPSGVATTTLITEDHDTTAIDVSGSLYFIFKNQQIPARFVQNSNGSLHLGIDGVSLCNSLTQNEQHNSILLTTLCNCYKNNNCTQKH